MSVTHLIFATPRTPGFRQALAAVSTGDRLLFMGHGACAVTRTDALTAIGDLEDIHVGVYGPDLESRGLLGKIADEAVMVLDEDGLLAWMTANRLNRTWQ
ncbi:MAG: DsrH/TusB family sulfur metabolism protein [Xanthomonadales bacterium]|nr:DsrH/TusB family sulfur metabolism protein [Xanthomonadales bacterium]